MFMTLEFEDTHVTLKTTGKEYACDADSKEDIIAGLRATLL